MVSSQFFAAVFLAAYAFLFFGVYLVGFWGVAAASFVYCFVELILICAVGLVLPYLKKDIYEKMPGKAKVAGIPLMSLVGLVGLIFNITWLSFFFIASDFQQSYGALTPYTVGVTVLLYAAPVVVFYIAKTVRKHQGIDISFAFKQIPPA